MENKISDLIEDALKYDDYEFRLNFLLSGLMSYEANDTKEKEEKCTIFLTEICKSIDALQETDSAKLCFLAHLKDTINNFLNFSE